MTIGTDDLGRITRQTAVVSSDGERLGEVDQVYTSDTSGDPAWVTVRTGHFGGEESFVPLSDASLDGDDLRVGVSRDAVHGAPRVDADGHLGVEEEDDLYRYYGVTNPDHSEDDVADAATGTERTREDPDRTGSDRDEELAERDAEGRDEVVDTPPAEAGDTRDDPAGREDVRPGERTTRLRRYVVTERVVQTVEELPEDAR